MKGPSSASPRPKEGPWTRPSRDRQGRGGARSTARGGPRGAPGGPGPSSWARATGISNQSRRTRTGSATRGQPR
eukprot:9121970-Alexandrium_andersonii.AAC.1